MRYYISPKPLFLPKKRQKPQKQGFWKTNVTDYETLYISKPLFLAKKRGFRGVLQTYVYDYEVIMYFTPLFLVKNSKNRGF